MEKRNVPEAQRTLVQANRRQQMTVDDSSSRSVQDLQDMEDGIRLSDRRCFLVIS